MDDLTEGLNVSDTEKSKIDKAPIPILAGMIKVAELIALTKTTQDQPTDGTTYAIRVHAKKVADADRDRHDELVNLRRDANKIAWWALGISILAIIVSVGSAAS